MGCSNSGETPTQESADASETPATTVKESKPAKPTAPLVAENLDIVLVKDGKPVHNMLCLPNDQAEPAAVQALKEYRVFIKRATGVEPLRVGEPEAGKPTIFFGRNPWSEKAGVNTDDLPSEGFRIRSIGQDIHIVGRDTPKKGAHQVAARVGMEPGTCTAPTSFSNVTTTCSSPGTMTSERSSNHGRT